MNTIQEVNYKKLSRSGYANQKYIEIEFVDGYLRFGYNDKTSVRSNTIDEGDEILRENYSSDSQMNNAVDRFKKYEEYSKSELEGFQRIILFAYVYLNDSLNEAIDKSESKIVLDGIKEKVIDMRKQLGLITNYIDSYEDMLDNFRDI
ncbi:hypothetical protein [Marinifilum flexuosum]|uniref:hypothetical protein n=1 Tax=Marinifilum flexuosum TaxID=1117708 RepID=UPI0024950140|nr:hypothetical protein [Marinifilum flexuosum]